MSVANIIPSTLLRRVFSRACLLHGRALSSVSELPKVYVTRRVPMKGIEVLKPHCSITQWEHDDPIPRGELLKNVAGKDALFCLLTEKIDAEVLDAAGNNLKVIGTMSVGYDHISLDECKKRGIPLGYTPDVLTDATAELTMALLLATARRIHEGIAAVKTGKWGTWSPLWLCGPTLTNSTVGIVGFGRIGVEILKRMKPFGVANFIYSDIAEKPYAKEFGATYTSFEELLQKSDFIVSTCELTPKTNKMFNKEAFSKMKSSAVFVNTSRGGIVDMDDLHEALRDNVIRAAGLDVTVPEPLPTTSPLLQLDNCLVVPHIGSATEETRSKMSELTGRNILAALQGIPMPAQIKY